MVIFYDFFCLFRLTLPTQPTPGFFNPFEPQWLRKRRTLSIRCHRDPMDSMGHRVKMEWEKRPVRSREWPESAVTIWGFFFLKAALKKAEKTPFVKSFKGMVEKFGAKYCWWNNSGYIDNQLIWKIYVNITWVTGFFNITCVGSLWGFKNGWYMFVYFSIFSISIKWFEHTFDKYRSNWESSSRGKLLMEEEHIET